MPAGLRTEVYEPAVHDLDAEYVRQIRPASRVAGALLRLRHRLHVLGVFLDCCRLAVIETFARRPNPPVLIYRPAAREPFTMLYYVLRHAVRVLARDPGFTGAAVLALALGIGANVAVFAVLEAVILRPLPYPDADGLVILRHRDTRTGITKRFIAIGDFIDIAARQTVLEHLNRFASSEGTIHEQGEPIRVAALHVSPGMFDMLQAPAVIGRTLQPDDGRPGAAPVIMLGHDLWQTRFGSDPGVIGRSIRLGPQTRQVVGVAARGFRFPPQASADVIVPLVTPHEAPAERKSGWTFAAGRLRPGLTIADAAPQLAALSRQLETEHPDQNLGSLYYPRSLRDELVGETRGQLLLLQGAVAFVLLIACVNVANLLLVRMLNRRHEMALRAALGAGRARLAAQLAAEIGVMAVAGAATGVVLAWWGVPLLVELVPGSVDVPGLDSVGINGGVLAFAACAAAGSGLLFTLAAAAAAGRASATALTAPARSGVSRSTRRATSALVMAEVALALVLLIGAGLVLRSFARLMSVDPGFRIQGLVALDIQLPPDRYREAEARRAFYRDTFAGLAAAPGVAGAGAAIVTPLTGNNWTVSFERSDRPVPAGQRPPDVGWQSVSAGFFETMGIPLRAGRTFDARDGGADSAP
ncbi:MAG TPA: ABC transporter permease, partial [Vicinamibacterales bacterium]|nr:ABC transporter permease [Vicinamibacterales bacterium]